MSDQNSIAWWLENDPECLEIVRGIRGWTRREVLQMSAGQFPGDVEQRFLAALKQWRERNPIKDPWQDFNGACERLSEAIKKALPGLDR